jgi:CspA family cold shock protein
VAFLEQMCYAARSSLTYDVLRVVDPLLELTARLQFVVREDVEVNVTTGTIKKVVSDRGFGFIAADDQKEYFFHRDGLNSSLDFDRLVGGEKVSFEIEQSPKGPRAKDVTKA